MDDLAETRDVTVGSSVQRHQLSQYLRAHGIRWHINDLLQANRPLRERDQVRTFTITASAAQWEGINQWLQRTKVD